MPHHLKIILDTLASWAEYLSSHVKLIDKVLSGMQGSYIELLTLLAIGLLAVIPVIVPVKHRQAYRHASQLFGIIIFVFITYTCMGVFGMVWNFFRGLWEIGRENVLALYFCSVPVTIMATAMIFGPTFCGWMCPTGALQEFTGLLLQGWHRHRRSEGWRFSWAAFAGVMLILVIFLFGMLHLTTTRIFYFDDFGIYWSEILIILLFCLLWRMKEWDSRLRSLRVLSFVVIVLATVAGLRVTSPVHFVFTKVYDPASLLATVVVVLSALIVPNIWCRYLCPWREAIGWAAKHSTRKLTNDVSKCTNCGACEEQCRVDAVRQGEVDSHECHLCMRCVDACPTGSLQIQEIWRAEE